MTEETGTEASAEFEEYGVVEPVPDKHRHYKFRDMLATWTVANANPTSWYVGSTLAAMGLLGAMSVTVVSNVVTYIILALVGLMGFRLGISNMGISRAAFGITGSKAPSFFNAFQFVGWCGVNTFIAAIPLTYLLSDFFGLAPYGTEHSGITLFIAVLIIMIPTAIISIAGGSKIIKLAQNICTVLLTILSVWIFIRIFQEFSWTDIVAWQPPTDIQMPFGVGIDALAALGFAWIMAVADYTRYTKTKKSATVAPMLGATFGIVWFALIGTVSAIAVAIQTNNFDPEMSDPGSVATMLGMGNVANLMIVVSTIAVNLINVYSGGFSTVNFTKKLNPKSSMFIISVLSTLVALVPIFSGNFLDTFQVFLGYLGAVFPPAIAIMIVDYYIHHNKKYKIDELDKKDGIYWYSKGINWPTILVWGLGALSYFVSARFTWVNQTIGSVFFCFIFSAILYYFIGTKLKKA